MADDTKTKLDEFDKAAAEAVSPTGPRAGERGDHDGAIHVGDTEVNAPDVELVDSGGDVPDVYVRNLDRRHPDENVGVVVPTEALGTLDVPIHAFLRGAHIEDALSAAAEDEPARPSESDAGDPAARGDN